MTTIRESENLTFNGIDFSDLGVTNVNLSSGLLQEPVWGNRSIVETKVRGRPVQYFHSVEDDPLSFTLNLAVLDEWDSDSIRAIMRALRTDFYAPLVLSAKPDQIIYAMIVDQPILNHTAHGTGYVSANFKCDSPWFYSAVIQIDEDLSSNSLSGTTFTITNSGDLAIPTLITITKVGTGDITITSLTNSNSITLTGLEDLSTIVIDGETEDATMSPRGVFTFTGATSDTETITINSRVYEFDDDSSIISGRIAVDISGGASSSESATALALSINGDVGADFVAYASGSTVVVITKSGIVFGSDYALSDTVTNGSWDDTSMNDVYPYSSIWDGNCLTLEYGVNRISVTGDCLISVKYEGQLLAGE